MERTRKFAKTRRAGWLVGWLAFAACSVDTGDIAFLPDDEFSSSQAGSGGSSPVPGTGGAPAAGGVAGSMTGANSCSPGQEGSARCTERGELEICKSQSYVLSKKCESQTRCSAPRKNCLDCEPGTFRCSKDTLEQCNLEGSAYELVQVCSENDCRADHHVGFCKVCEPGEAVCERAERTLADSDNEGTDGVSVRDSVRICNENGSGTEVVETCTADKPVCDAEAKRCLVCEKGAILCSGSQLTHCSPDGLKFEAPLRDCGHPDLCDAQHARCNLGECSRLLESSDPDARVACRGEESNELSYCTEAGAWKVLALCASRAACEAGLGPRLCRDPQEAFCVPGSTSCADDERTLLRCAEFAEPDSLAPSGGSWYEFATCAGGCEINAGVAECTSAAEPRPYTDEAVCTPGDSDYLDCSGESCVEMTCPSDEICAGRDQGCASCVPGTSRCDGNELVRCEEDGSGEQSVETCGEDEVCDRFRGACLPGRPGELFCHNGDLRRVTTDGTGQLVASCGSQALCSTETGCKEPVCVVGSRVCDPENGVDVLSCPDGTGLQSGTPTRCASADRCEDGLGCVAAFRVAAGEAHTCALLLQENGDFAAPGLVKCWGANESGQLGNGTTLLGDESEARPVVFRARIADVSEVAPRFLSSGLCAGKSFTCADVQLEKGKTVMCWGSNEQGQLGLGGLPSQSTPRALNAATSPVIKGGRDTNQEAFLDLSRVTCGADFACGLDAQGFAWCWGANDVGQLGIGEATSAPWPSAQRADGGKGDSPAFVGISAGERHVCGIDEEAMLWCWGGGARGQLGGSTAMASPVPRALGLRATTFALGRDFTLLRAPDGAKPTAFGQNFFGQLATGTSVAANTPVSASAASEQVSLLFGGPTAAHACALSAGALECWGANSLGQLGDGSTEDRYAPVVALDAGSVEVFGATGSVALGRSHTCAVDASGGLWCWGGNERKQLGASVSGDFSRTPIQALAASVKMR